MICNDWFLSLGCLVQISAFSCWIDSLIITLCPSSCAQSLSHVWLFVTPWNVAHQAPLSMEILQARILEWIAMPSSRGSSQPSDRTCISHTAGEFFTVWAAREAHISLFISGHFICSEGYLSYRIYPLPLSFNIFVIYLFPCFQTTYIIIIEVNSCGQTIFSSANFWLLIVVLNHLYLMIC